MIKVTVIGSGLIGSSWAIAFAKAGHELTEEQIAGIRQKVKDEDYRKEAKARPDVNSEVQRITAERAQARAAEAAKKAAEAAQDGESDLGDLL